jgi:serine/threonine protein kinase
MSTDDALVGRILDEKYRIDDRLKRGGMGAVYLATHLGTGRTVALKVIAPELMANPEVVERFKREAIAAGRLRHPNVVNVTDFGFTTEGEGKLAYLVMEHLDGMTLAELLERQRRPPLPRVVDILRQTCAAVEEAHRNGIIHRDLKPENIWLRPRARGGYDVKVLDFGVAMLRCAAGEIPAPDAETDAELLPLPAVDPDAPTQQEPPSHPQVETTLPSTSGLQSGPGGAHADPPPATDTLDEAGSSDGVPSTDPRPPDAAAAGPPRITQFGTLLGTPLYMPPEQWLHREVDARSDVYSLGVIAYRMIAGEVPFNGRSTSISMQHVREPPVPLSRAAPGVPASVAAAVMAALAKKPSERPPSAQSFATALAAGAEGTVAILLRSTALAAAHFPTFLGVTAMVFSPILAACALRLVNRLLVEAGLVPARVGAVVGMACYAVYSLGVWLLQPVAVGLLTPRARDALLAPDEPPRPRPEAREIVASLRRMIPATLVIVAGTVAIGKATWETLIWLTQRAGLLAVEGTDYTPREWTVRVLAASPGSIVVAMLLGRCLAFPSVVTMERLGGLTALRRALGLMRPFRASSAWIAVLHISVYNVSAWIVWLSLGEVAGVSYGRMLETRTDSVVHDVSLLLVSIAVVVGWTFTFTMEAVLYLAGRQAEGVTLDAIGGSDQTPAFGLPKTPRS